MLRKKTNHEEHEDFYKIVLFMISILFILILGGCKSQQKETKEDLQATKKESRPEKNEKNETQEAANIPDKFSRVFAGNIDKYKVEMKLVREGDKLSGFYYYDKGKDYITPDDYIRVEGTIEKDGSFSLKEYTNKQTGVFQGKIKGEGSGEAGELQIAGTWLKSNSSKALPVVFTMSERRYDVGDGLKLVSKEKNEENKKLKYSVDILYPQLEGENRENAEKFNHEVDEMLKNVVKDFKDNVESNEKDNPVPDSLKEGADQASLNNSIEIGYDVMNVVNGMVSILFYTDTYYAGAAHPNYTTFPLNYDIKRGKQLELGDLFKPGSDYLKAISAYCIENLSKRNDTSGVEEGAAPKPDNYKSWNVAPKGLLITFDPYQVASYAAGPQKVLIPYSALKDMISPDSPVAKLINT